MRAFGPHYVGQNDAWKQWEGTAQIYLKVWRTQEPNELNIISRVYQLNGANFRHRKKWSWCLALFTRATIPGLSRGSVRGSTKAEQLEAVSSVSTEQNSCEASFCSVESYPFRTVLKAQKSNPHSLDVVAQNDTTGP